MKGGAKRGRRRYAVGVTAKRCDGCLRGQFTISEMKNQFKLLVSSYSRRGLSISLIDQSRLRSGLVRDMFGGMKGLFHGSVDLKRRVSPVHCVMIVDFNWSMKF